jgi:D-3-phosphoglycerate dehydrogenase / 2-oxoglutarate reductase
MFQAPGSMFLKNSYLSFMKVVFLDTVHPILAERLSKAGYSCLEASGFSKDECLNTIADAQGIVIRSRFTMNEEFLQFAPNLKWIARSGAGMENIDERYCKKRGITLYNAPEGNRNAVGEHALGMLLSLMNKLHTADREVRSGKWDREGNRGVELDGKTVGIIGYGNNGSAFAKKLRGFDVKLMAYDKYKKGFGDHFVMECTLNAIMKNADVISLHIPQNKDTTWMINDAFFDKLQKPIWLLNLSRGKIVETAALVRALKTGKVLGAGLDVLEYEKSSFESFFEQELPPDFEYLLNSNKVILSPHVGGWTEESYFKLSDVLADKILSVD